MIVLLAKVDMTQFNKVMKNAIQYSEGFLDGVEMNRIEFNRFLGGFTAEALNKFIDAKARSGNNLHHVYEPGQAGSPNARLFKFNVESTKYNISFKGNFLPSKGIPQNGGTPLVDRANIMENDISVTITPRLSNVLAFEDNGEMVFTANSITIEHPGGDGVAGSFGETVADFFDHYFNNAFLEPLLKDLSTADEFTKSFGTGGRPIGVRAGRQYLTISGMGIE